MLVCTCMHKGPIAIWNLWQSVRLFLHSLFFNMSEASGAMFTAMLRGCGEQQRWWPVGMIMMLLTARFDFDDLVT